eukprot:gene560-1217_t
MAAMSTSVNTFRNIFSLYDYDVGPEYLGSDKVRGLRNFRGDILPSIKPHDGSSSPMRLQTAPEKTPPNRGSSRLEAQPVQQAMVTFKPSSPPDGVKQRTPPTPKTSMSPRKYLAKLASIDDDDNVKESDTFVPAKKSPIRSKAVDKTCSSCIHDAGQELCYLCYQRQRRNIPVYLHEERRKKEQEEDRLLQQYQHLKDYDAILKDQNTKAVNREEAQKIAAFNLGTSEAIKGKKNERPTDFHRSYIFHKRPVSPPFSLKQHKYNVDLEEQVVQKSNTEASARKNKDFMERLEQVELAKDLAAQREQYVRNKRLQSEEYRKALDTQIYIKKCIERQLQIDNDRPRKYLSVPKPNIIQPFMDSSAPTVGKLKNSQCSKRMSGAPKHTVRFKPLPLPAAEPDSEAPVFGKFDMNYEKMTEKRIRARQLYEDQLKATAEKKRQAILSDLRNQKEESAMLSNARRDLLEESVYRNKEQVNLRRDLEDTWLQAAKSKQMREKEERRRAQSPGVLLHEQCSKYYHRCKECKRKLANSGESNVWSDSRYLSGSRIMV